jgi:hypothetical protein
MRRGARTITRRAGQRPTTAPSDPRRPEFYEVTASTSTVQTPNFARHSLPEANTSRPRPGKGGTVKGQSVRIDAWQWSIAEPFHGQARLTIREGLTVPP